MKVFLGPLSIALLASCATSKQIVGLNGAFAHAIRCGAAVADACLEKAGEVCSKGYVVLNSRGSQYFGQLEQGPLGSMESGGIAFSGSATSMPLISPNTMLVECKG